MISVYDSSSVLRALIRTYNKDLAEANNTGNKSWARECRRKIKLYSERLPHIELMEKLKENL